MSKKKRNRKRKKNRSAQINSTKQEETNSIFLKVDYTCTVPDELYTPKPEVVMDLLPRIESQQSWVKWIVT